MTPSPFMPCDTAAEANWAIARLHHTLGQRVTSIVPAGFEAYVRVLFPFRGRGDSPIPWHQVAAWAGRPLFTSTTSNELLTSLPAARRRQLDLESPLAGTVPRPVASSLVSVLSKHTTTPESCYFAVWEGKGGLAPYHGPGAEFHTPARTWLLFSATVADAVAGFEMTVGESRIPPNMWWPADHNWYFATEVDNCCAYIGCDKATAQKIMDADVEAFEVGANDPPAP